MLELTTPTPLASALSSLVFIVIVAIIYGFTSFTRRGATKADKPGMFEAVIAVLRRLDRSVVHLFSRFTGTRYRKKYIRMPMLLSYFLVLTAASVFMPWPFNMGFVGFGIFSIFVVFRHWSRDEDEAVENVPFERKDIKIDGTLGAEVLLAVAFLFVFAPIAFAQLQVQGIGFSVAGDAGPFTFLLYTLIETVKAGSLIDYYDLYAERIGFERIGAPADPSSWAKATIMAYRLSLNLLVLAAIKRLLDVAKRRAEGADLRAVTEALRQTDIDRQIEGITKLKDFALRGRGNARDLLEKIAEPRQSEMWPIAPETRFEASGALLDYGTQRGGASALYAAIDGYRSLIRDGFEQVNEPKKWRASAHNLGNALVELGQQIGDPERLRDATEIYDRLLADDGPDAATASRFNTMMVRANVQADLAMMTGERPDLEKAVELYRASLSMSTPDVSPTQTAMLNTNLGATLADIAEIAADEDIIREAIAAYRAALADLSPKTEVETWSMAQNNLGNALADLGHWTQDADALRASLVAHGRALEVRTVATTPLLWAMSQTNMANALSRLAKLEKDSDRLEEAISHYTAAQSIYQREDFPRDWSWAEASLAASHIDLGHMRSDTDAFETAITYCDGAIGGYASADMPAKKAWVQGLKGNALVGLRRFDEALDVFRAARSWQTYENAGDDWVMTTNNLAACLFELARHDEAVAVLEKALLTASDDRRLRSTLTLIKNAEPAATNVDAGEAAVDEQIEVQDNAPAASDAPVVASEAETGAVEKPASLSDTETVASDAPGLNSVEEPAMSPDPVAGPDNDETVSERPAEPSSDAHATALDGNADAVAEPDALSDGEAAALAEPDRVERYYHVSVQGYCGEFVIGQLNPDFYNYWKGRDDFEEQILSLGDPDEFEAGSPSPHPDGRESEGWYAIDDVAHINNAVFHGNRIYVDEVVPDADAYTGYSRKSDGYSEDFDIDAIQDAMPAEFCRLSRNIQVNTSGDASAAPVFVGKSIEKGSQTDVYVKTAGAFDVAKLSFEVWLMDGDQVIASVSYEGEELEIFADSSTGKAFYAYMGQLM